MKQTLDSDFTPGGILTLGELHIIAVLFPAVSLSGGDVLANSFL